MQRPSKEELLRHPWHLNNMPSHETFKLLDFGKAHAPRFRKYAKARIDGFPRYVALRMIFGEQFVGQNSMSYCYAIEANPYYQWTYANQLSKTQFEHMWSPRKATVALLQIVNDDNAKETARLSAIKELNVLHSITITDDKGNTRANRGMDDFYKETSEKGEETESPDDGAADDKPNQDAPQGPNPLEVPPEGDDEGAGDLAENVSAKEF